MPTLAKSFDKIASQGWLKRLFVAFVLVLILITIFFYWWADRRTEASLVEQMLHREQIIVRAGAQSIENYLVDIERQIVLLARTPRITSMGNQTQDALNDFVEVWEGTPLTSAILASNEGMVLFNANNLEAPLEVGDSISDRGYFIWAREAKTGEVYFGTPIISRIGATKGKYIIPIVTPVFRGGEFSGVLGVAILLPKLTETYLNSLKISENTRIYLVNADGVLLYSPYEQLIGLNYLDYLGKHPFPGSERVVQELARRAKEKDEGKLDIYLPNERQKGALTRFLIAHASVKFGNKSLLLAIASPIDEALVFVGPFHANQAAGIAFGLIAILLLSLIFIVGIRFMQQKAYLEGFARGRDHGARGTSSR